MFQSGVLILYGFPSLSSTFRYSIKPITTPFILPLTQVALTGSVYSVIMVATERYLHICKPFSHTRVGNTVGLISSLMFVRRLVN